MEIVDSAHICDSGRVTRSAEFDPTGGSHNAYAFGAEDAKRTSLPEMR